MCLRSFAFLQETCCMPADMHITLKTGISPQEGVGTTQNFWLDTGYHISCVSAVMLGLPFTDIACSTYHDNYTLNFMVAQRRW